MPKKCPVCSGLFTRSKGSAVSWSWAHWKPLPTAAKTCWDWCAKGKPRSTKTPSICCCGHWTPSRCLCEKAVAERADGEKPVALLQELERAFKMVSQGQALTVAPASEAPPAPAPQRPKQQAPLRAPLPQAAQPPKPQQPRPTPPKHPTQLRAAPTKAADGTTDNRQVVFLRLISNGLPILERLANSIATKQEAAHRSWLWPTTSANP
jgi:hypothetical protein